MEKSIQYKAGEAWRMLPFGATNFHKVDFGRLSTVTQGNVELMGFLYNIKWKEVWEYNIHHVNGSAAKLRDRHQIAHGMVVYGEVNGHPITYMRRESQERAAGQTVIYFGEGHRIQVSVLLKRVCVSSSLAPGHLDKWVELVGCTPVKKWLLSTR